YAESGKIRPHVAAVMPFDRVSEAYAMKSRRDTVGRIVVSVPAVNPVDSVPGPWNGLEALEAPTPTPERTQGSTGMDIAIIGMSGRYAGAGNHTALWDNLAAGECSVGPVPTERWSAQGFHDADPTR